ncbi:hypothetical protein RQN30_10675 [Arcanobacterium hippocoleae]
MKANRPVTLSGTQIRIRHTQIRNVLRVIHTLFKYTPQEAAGTRSVKQIEELLQQVEDLVMELELEK